MSNARISFLPILSSNSFCSSEAILAYKKAIRLNPIMAYAYSEQYEKAIPIWNKAIERNPDYFFAYLGLTMVYQLYSNELKAREAAAESYET